MTTQKCSARRTVLYNVQRLVQELININEAADRTRTAMIAAGLDPEDAVNLILAGGGPSTTAATLTAQITAELSVAGGHIGWEYLAE